MGIVNFPLDNILSLLLFISRYRAVSKERGCSEGHPCFYIIDGGRDEKGEI